MRRLRVAGCQFNPTVGDLDGNVARTVEMLEQAEEAGADLAVFPELSITGYPPEDLVLKPGFVEDNLEALATISARARDCAVVVGFVDLDRDLYNAAALCYQGQVELRYHKRLLPNYAVFDEQRYFSAGSHQLELVEVNGLRVGLSICEDAWSPTGPIADLARGGAELVLNLNGSPFHTGKQGDRETMLATRAADASVHIVYVNQVGGQDELVFDGGSIILDAEGHIVARAPLFEEHVLVADVEIPPLYRKRRLDPRGQFGPLEMLPYRTLTPEVEPTEPPLTPEPAEVPDELEQVWSALVLGTRDYVTKNGFTDVGVALSGGIDSSIVVALAVEALGPDRVHAVLMPSRYSSEHSISDAETLCRNLGVEHRMIPIEPGHAALLDMLAPSFDGHDADTTEENLQSRIRGVTMMALSNKLGWLILTTGNKSETSVGYSTLYGDTAGGFAVIKDVPKVMVYDLCRWRNATATASGGHPVIPEHVINKAPSAELRPDQRDDQSLPPYEILDPILEGYVEGDLTASELIAAGHDAEIVNRIVRLVDIAEYKRRQNPPGIRISAKAFGRDRRIPITNRYRG
ncbi:MAG: NAD+ synthase [Actinomycetia bacterium]|nr:NAD+ synthase [Actinomycetes bacterium]